MLRIIFVQIYRTCCNQGYQYVAKPVLWGYLFSIHFNCFFDLHVYTKTKQNKKHTKANKNIPKQKNPKSRFTIPCDSWFEDWIIKYVNTSELKYNCDSVFVFLHHLVIYVDIRNRSSHFEGPCHEKELFGPVNNLNMFNYRKTVDCVEILEGFELQNVDVTVVSPLKHCSMDQFFCFASQ